MTHKSETFNDMLRNSVAAAKILYEIGVRQDDVIAIISENRHEYPTIAFGAFILNAIVAPINVTYTERKIILLSALILKITFIVKLIIYLRITR